MSSLLSIWALEMPMSTLAMRKTAFVNSSAAPGAVRNLLWALAKVKSETHVFTIDLGPTSLQTCRHANSFFFALALPFSFLGTFGNSPGLGFGFSSFLLLVFAQRRNVSRKLPLGCSGRAGRQGLKKEGDPSVVDELFHCDFH